MPDNEQRIFITGGTGFVGSALVSALGDRPIRLLVRDRARHQGRETHTIEVVEGDVTDAGSLRETMNGCDTVIHLVAVIEETRGQSFDRVIRLGTEQVVQEAKTAGVRRFVQVSAIGAVNDPALPYQQTKWRAEQAVRASGLDWTVLRPSIIFGPGDGFISLLASVVRQFPITPIVGDGSARFQPVAVDDVAAAVVASLAKPETIGETLELGGPDVLSYAEILELIARQLQIHRRSVHVPIPLMRAVIAVSRLLPRRLRPPITVEQLKMLRLENTAPDSATERLIGRRPKALADNLAYIERR